MQDLDMDLVEEDLVVMEVCMEAEVAGSVEMEVVMEVAAEDTEEEQMAVIIVVEEEDILQEEEMNMAAGEVMVQEEIIIKMGLLVLEVEQLQMEVVVFVLYNTTFNRGIIMIHLHKDYPFRHNIE